MPEASMILTCTSPAEPSRSKAAVLIFSTGAPMRSPADSTVRPIIEVPCSTCMEVNCEDIASMVLLSWLMPTTVLICAICEVICALSMGFIGS
ncbi:hypothetical protein D3C71_1751790 [compost metagenome]